MRSYNKKDFDTEEDYESALKESDELEDIGFEKGKEIYKESLDKGEKDDTVRKI